MKKVVAIILFALYFPGYVILYNYLFKPIHDTIFNFGYPISEIVASVMTDANGLMFWFFTISSGIWILLTFFIALSIWIRFLERTLDVDFNKLTEW